MVSLSPVAVDAFLTEGDDSAVVITNHEAWKLYEKYVSAWNTNSIEQRLKIATEVLSENIEYQTVRHDLCTGRSQVIEDMATFQEKFPEAILKSAMSLRTTMWLY
jgi:hypothetical protein